MEPSVTKKASVLTVLKILLLMYLVTGVLLLLLALLLWKLQLSEGVVSVAVVVIYVVAGFLGGFVAGRRMGSRKFLWGMVMGGCYFAVLVAGSVLLHQGLEMEANRVLTTLVLCMGSGMAGGMVG
jgi:putative membrane protein (TIGR04086 family)